MEAARIDDDARNAKPVLTEHIYDSETFADDSASSSIDLGHNNSNQGVIYQMADKTQTSPPEGKTWGQVYYEEVEALVAGGTKNAEAVRQVGEKHGKNENAVRGGIFQYKKAHINGSSGPTATVRRLRQKAASVDDLVASAREALEAALDLIDREVEQAKADLDAAQARYDQVAESVAERKADIEQKLKALA
jgi:hypothetical protein